MSSKPLPPGACFDGSLTTPPALPRESIDNAHAVLQSGHLFRYGDQQANQDHASALEVEFARLLGRRYCIAVNSGGSALFLSLKALGVKPGDQVLFSAFTLAPVPGAIDHCGAEGVPVEIGDSYLTDLADLEAKCISTDARVFLLSHMRGHMADMDQVRGICSRHGVALVEDCAHTMGANWDGQASGTFGATGCFSTQSYKHLNGGEGGLIVTDDDLLAAKCILYSGSYEHYARHRARPDESLFTSISTEIPNYSLRMSNLTAAVLRPQLTELDKRAKHWKASYRLISDRLAESEYVKIPMRDLREDFVPSSLQFSLPDFSERQIQAFLDYAHAHGVTLAWFGQHKPSGFTSRREHWCYLPERHQVPRSDETLRTLIDCRLPLSLSEADCDQIGKIILRGLQEATN